MNTSQEPISARTAALAVLAVLVAAGGISFLLVTRPSDAASEPARPAPPASAPASAPELTWAQQRAAIEADIKAKRQRCKTKANPQRCRANADYQDYLLDQEQQRRDAALDDYAEWALTHPEQ